MTVSTSTDSCNIPIVLALRGTVVTLLVIVLVVVMVRVAICFTDADFQICCFPHVGLIAGLEASLTGFLTVHFYCLSGRCARCGENVVGEGTGCTAMDQVFHVDCFTCIICNNKLRGQPFYAVEKKAYCEPCYIVSPDLTLRCSAKITPLAGCQSLQIKCSRQIFTWPQT